MKLKEFPEVNVRIAEKQEGYETTPAYYNNEDGSITFGYILTKEEIIRIQETGEIWVKQLTFGKAMQPIELGFEKEELI